MTTLKVSVTDDTRRSSSDDDLLLLAEEKTENKLKEDNGMYWDDNARKNWTMLLFVGSILVYCVRTSMSVCVPAIAKEMGWNKQISGMALSAFFFGYLSTNVLGGYFADRHGGEKMILYSSTIWATLTLLLPYFTTSQTFLNSGTFAILATRFFTGCSQGFFYPSFSSLVSKHVKTDDKGLVSGFVFSGCAIGTIATGFFGSIIIEHSSWRMVFVAIAFSSYIWIYWLRLYYRRNKDTKEKIASDFNCKVSTQEPFPWKLLLRKPAVWALLTSFLTNGFSFYVLLSWTPAYFHDAFPESKGWIFNVVPWTVSFFIQNIAGYYSNTLLASGTSVTHVRKVFSGVLFLGTAIFSLLLNAVETFQQALLIMSLLVGVNSFSTSAMSLNPQDLTPKHSGALFGLCNSLGALGGSIGVYLTGFVLEHSGHWSSVFIINAVMSLIGFVVFQLFGSGEKVV